VANSEPHPWSGLGGCPPNRPVSCLVNRCPDCGPNYFPGCGPGCSPSCCPYCSLHRSTRCSTGRSGHRGLSRSTGRSPRCSPRSSDRCSPDCSANSFLSCPTSRSVHCSLGCRAGNLRGQMLEHASEPSNPHRLIRLIPAGTGFVVRGAGSRPGAGGDLWIAGAQLPPFLTRPPERRQPCCRIPRQLPLHYDLADGLGLSLRLRLAYEVEAGRQLAKVVRARVQDKHVPPTNVEQPAWA